EQARVDRRRLRRGRAFGSELSQTLQVLGGDAIEWVESYGVRIGVARVCIATELSQGFAEAVVRIHLIGEHIQDFAVYLSSLVPAILHRQSNCLFRLGALLTQPVLSGKRSHTPPCARGSPLADSKGNRTHRRQP